MRRQTEIFSIFGHIESVVAEAMVYEKKFNKINFEDIPATARFNDEGVRAIFAVSAPVSYLQEFEQRIRTLRA